MNLDEKRWLNLVDLDFGEDIFGVCGLNYFSTIFQHSLNGVWGSGRVWRGAGVRVNF
jgi:hypothetical protein